MQKKHVKSATLHIVTIGPHVYVLGQGKSGAVMLRGKEHGK